MYASRAPPTILGASRALRLKCCEGKYICPGLYRNGSFSLSKNMQPMPSLLHRPNLSYQHFSTSNLVRFTPSTAFSEKSSIEKNQNTTSAPAQVPEPKPPLLTRAWTTIKKEAAHYYHGFRLLGKEIRISVRLQGKILRGKSLTRRERRQLKRTTQDLLRLIPFSVFIIVPFMELLLPVALKLFPQMLPSTFVDEYKEAEKRRRLLKVRLEMAKFLQETVRESGITSHNNIRDSDEFKTFFRKLRTTGESPSTDDIVRVARLFENDLTLDNLSRAQLVGMCRYMNINAFGTDNFLRYTLRKRLDKLKQDDRLIEYEGVESLSEAELIHAAASRGIRTSDASTEQLQLEMKQWIDLHLHRDLSGSLLILSKAFSFTRKGDTAVNHIDSLKDTLSTLPDTLLKETELNVSPEASYKDRLEVLEAQEELIEDEAKQELEAEEARKAAKEAEKAASADVNADGTESTYSTSKELPVKRDDARLTSEQLGELAQVLSIISSKSSVLKERQDLARLMDQNSAMEVSEDNALAKKIRNMIQKIDTQLSEYDSEVGTKMNICNLGEGGKISLSDLKNALGLIKHRPSEDSLDILLKKLDVDHDNWVPLDHIFSLIEGEGLGTIIDDQASDLIDQGQEIRKVEELKPRKEDIIADA